MGLKHLTGFLDLRDILEAILGDQKERPRIEIEVKEIERFLKSAELAPLPELITPLGLEQDAPFIDAEYEMIFKGGRPPVNAQG